MAPLTSSPSTTNFVPYARSRRRRKVIPIALEAVWLAHLRSLPSWEAPLRRTVILSPHPDDETLGAGGLIAHLRCRKVDVDIIAITDGENAYGGVPGLASVREREQTDALAILGIEAARVHRLRIADSAVAPQEEQIIRHLRPLLKDAEQLVAPWPGDFHPDHEATGRAARRLATELGIPLAYYFFWTWHRGTPQLLQDLPLVSFQLPEDAQALKRAALRCHRSQLIHPVTGTAEDAILPPYLLEPAWRPFEVFLPA